MNARPFLLVSLVLCAVAVACGPSRQERTQARARRRQQTRTRLLEATASAASIDTTAADTVTGETAPVPGPLGLIWRGVYQRDRQDVSFRVCGGSRRFRVRTSRDLQDQLDANVEFRAARPQTTVFAQVEGDSVSGRSGDTAAVRDTIVIAAVDTVRELDAGECNPKRPATPPPLNTAKLEAAMRRALGADAGLVRSGNYEASAVWLDRDLVGDAVVLIKGGDLCTSSGCTLLAFAGTRAGDYVLSGRTIGVKAPVYVLRHATSGWQDLAATVAQGVYGSRLVQLTNRGRGYPANAALEAGVRAPQGRPVLRR